MTQVPDASPTRSSTVEPQETIPAVVAESEAVYPLLPEIAGRLQELADRVSGAFTGSVVWPGADEPVRIVFPPGISRVAGRVPPPPVDPWEALSAVATVADTAHSTGLRLNGLSLAVLVCDAAGRSVGVCLPACLTAADTPAEDVPVIGLSGAFAAPEIQRYTEYTPGVRADVFSAAVIFYYLATARRPVDLAEVGFDPRCDTDRFGPAVREELTAAFHSYPSVRPASVGALLAGLRAAAARDAARTDLTITAGGASDIGLGGRESNQDGYGAAVDTRGDGHGTAVWAAVVVADGMGGGQCGERASRHAVERFLARYGAATGWSADGPAEAGWPDSMRAWVTELNADTRTLADTLGAASQFGTTLSGLAVVGRWAVLVQLGDSRVYRVRGADVRLLTKDQSRAQQLYDEGQITAAELAVTPFRSDLVSFLGSDRCIPQVELIELRPGDRFVLASDGAFDGFRDSDLPLVVNSLAPTAAAAELIRRAKGTLAAPDPMAGDPSTPAVSDNMTVVVMSIGDSEPATAPPPSGDQTPQEDS